ncbi:hypothetical protein ACJ41O_005111 [Fusarium nematophilum]
MAAKAKNPLSAAHTAGIFADIAVDGPEIGTLVAIVDRAKNLPNRKTIGKQDPYCAARLGKEAKKTTTDIRGGQTPKWDQELRFTVHDCPDYYQLKISVFTDDKRTDLVGESWIDLRGIIVAGGGQNDMWQTLTCKGKYAGEIRVEITFYDTRPKPDKPAPKPKQPSPEQEQGSVKQRTLVKRRPLPSDPVTGEAPAASPPAAPTTAPPAPAPQPAPAPAPAPAAAAPAGPDHRTPPRVHAKQSSHSGTFIPTQSPLQVVEYNTPPSQSSRSRHPEHYSPSPHAPVPQEYVTPTRGEAPRPSRQSVNPYEGSPRHYDDRDYSPRYTHPQEQMDPRGHYSPAQIAYDQPPPPMDDPRQFSSMENERPPPPPAHRSRHSSSSQELVPRGTYDTSPIKVPHMRHDVLRNEAQRQSMSSAYPGRPTFRGYDSAPATNPAPSPNGVSYDTAPRHNSYDASYDPHYRSMQPTVEDVPESTSPTVNNFRHSGPRLSRSEELMFDENPSPAPLVLRRSPGASPYRDDYSPSQPARGYQNQDEYQMAMSPSHGRDFSRSPGDNSYQPHSSQGHHPGHRSDMELVHIQSSPSYALQGLPAALVPGLDASQSQELTDLIYEDRRHERQQYSHSMSTPPRGRPRNESLQGYNQAPEQNYAMHNQAPEQSYAIQPYNRRAIAYSSAADQQVVKPRAVSPNPHTSPNPQHRIKRKSVSPAPPPEDSRRKSEVPFGPDSYDALNPSLVSSNDGTSPSPDFMGGGPSKKIITHDGREVDPSDHLPMETWAPEPEPKQQEPASETRTRPALSGAQPMPPSTRRTPRAGRHSMSAVNPSYAFSDEPRTPPAPVSAGRTRLQKKNQRPSAGNSPAASSPLAPISKDNYQERQPPYGNSSLRGLPRANTWDFEDENRGGVYGGPPIPAKIPLPLMSGANGPGNELALMEEMQRIDIGTGRSRRRGGY